MSALITNSVSLPEGWGCGSAGTRPPAHCACLWCQLPWLTPHPAATAPFPTQGGSPCPAKQESPLSRGVASQRTASRSRCWQPCTHPTVEAESSPLCAWLTASSGWSPAA